MGVVVLFEEFVIFGKNMLPFLCCLQPPCVESEIGWMSGQEAFQLTMKQKFSRAEASVTEGSVSVLEQSFAEFSAVG